MAASITANRWPAGPAGRWLTTDRHILPICVGLSLALHGLWLSVRAPSVTPREAAHAPGAALPMRARLVSTPAATARVEPSGPAMTEAVGPPPSSSRAKPEPSPPQPLAVAPNALAVPPGADVPPAPSIAPPASAAGHDDYVPRPLLSVAPVAQAPVILVAPLGETRMVRHVGILSLFIDEEGRVQRIAANEPSLPPAFEQAAREAFMAAQFSPGQVDGRAVKSRLRVEVVFDSTPALSALPQASNLGGAN